MRIKRKCYAHTEDSFFVLKGNKEELVSRDVAFNLIKYLELNSMMLDDKQSTQEIPIIIYFKK